MRASKKGPKRKKKHGLYVPFAFPCLLLGNNSGILAAILEDHLKVDRGES
jgi:hypothetical protein